MLLPDDLALISADSSLPGLRHALDPEALCGLLAPLSSAVIDRATPVYVRYKPETSCLVGWRIETQDATTDLYVRAHHRDFWQKIEKVHERRAVDGVLGIGITSVPHLLLAIFEAPNDHVLKQLAVLHEPRSLRRIAINLGAKRAAPKLSLRRLRYKPERRYVAQVRRKSKPKAAIKLYSPEDYDSAKRKALFAATLEDVQTPELVHVEDRQRSLLFDWCPGCSLAELAPQQMMQAAEASGVMLAAMHRAPAPADLPQGNERASYAAAASAIVETLPRLANVVTQVAGPALDYFSEPSPARFVHGDFSPEQIVVGDDLAPTFLDFDRSAAGSAEMDIASFGARLELEALIGVVDEPVKDAMLGALQQGYRAGGGDDQASRPAPEAMAAALLRLAPEPFRLRLEGWPDLTASLLARAAAHLRRVCIAH